MVKPVLLSSPLEADRPEQTPAPLRSHISLKDHSETDSVEILKKDCSPVESPTNLPLQKSSRTLKRCRNKRKLPNSILRIKRALEKLRNEHVMQLMKSDAETEAEKLSENWKESLSVARHSASERLEAGKSKPYLYATGAGFVLGRMYNSRKTGRGWLDTSHH